MVGMSACASYYPEPVDGLPDPESWVALPLRRWLVEDRVEPEAVAICRPPDCGSPMVVGVVQARGRDADDAEAVLKAPERLARALEAMRDRKSRNPDHVRTIASAERLNSGRYKGFVLTLSRSDGDRHAFGAALGRRTANGLRVVLAIGADRDAVEATVRRVAERHLGS
jgi:hypothetical protein